MEYIELLNETMIDVAIAAIGVFITVSFMVAAVGVVGNLEATPWFGIAGALLGIGALAVAFFIDGDTAGREEMRVPDVIAQVEQKYGITLSPEQVTDLNYPAHRPDVHSAVFGETTILDPETGNEVDAELVWDGRRLFLRDADVAHNAPAPGELTVIGQ